MQNNKFRNKRENYDESVFKSSKFKLTFRENI